MFLDDPLASLKQLSSWGRGMLVTGSRRRVVVRNSRGAVYADVPVIVAATVTLFLPVIAGFAAIAALALKFTLSIDELHDDTQALEIKKRATKGK
jgi:hypothetical protein